MTCLHTSYHLTNKEQRKRMSHACRCLHDPFVSFFLFSLISDLWRMFADLIDDDFLSESLELFPSMLTKTSSKYWEIILVNRENDNSNACERKQQYTKQITLIWMYVCSLSIQRSLWNTLPVGLLLSSLENNLIQFSRREYLSTTRHESIFFSSSSFPYVIYMYIHRKRKKLNRSLSMNFSS